MASEWHRAIDPALHRKDMPFTDEEDATINAEVAFTGLLDRSWQTHGMIGVPCGSATCTPWAPTSPSARRCRRLEERIRGSDPSLGETWGERGHFKKRRTENTTIMYCE